MWPLTARGRPWGFPKKLTADACEYLSVMMVQNRLLLGRQGFVGLLHVIGKFLPSVLRMELPGKFVRVHEASPGFAPSVGRRFSSGMTGRAEERVQTTHNHYHRSDALPVGRTRNLRPASRLSRSTHPPANSNRVRGRQIIGLAPLQEEEQECEHKKPSQRPGKRFSFLVKRKPEVPIAP